MGRERTQLASILASALHGSAPVEHPLTSKAEPLLNFEEKGRFFVGLLNLRSVLKRLSEHHWLLTPKSSDDAFFWQSVARARDQELQPFADLDALFQPYPARNFKSAEKELRTLTQALIQETLTYSESEFRQFIHASAQEMWTLSEFDFSWSNERRQIEASRADRLASLGPMATWEVTRPTLQESILPEGLFRAFDMMDDVLQLEYERDLLMDFTPNTKERIFENSGAGVQTSYATAMIALRELDLQPGDTLIDLGSGYGRVGIIGGLLRSDLQFIGYEFVRHRVECSQNASERSGMAGHVKFYCQDLGDPDFEIPEAAAYYLYDPFNEETYQRVLRRIHAVASRKPVRVVTNADAGAWFQKLMVPTRWFPAKIHDGGTLRIFRSRP